jgi:hypothetical protein
MRSDCHDDRFAAAALGLNNKRLCDDLDVREAGVLQILLNLLRQRQILMIAGSLIGAGLRSLGIARCGGGVLGRGVLGEGRRAEREQERGRSQDLRNVHSISFQMRAELHL